MSKFFLFLVLFGTIFAGRASAQYEKVVLMPAEMRAASANAFFEGSFDNDGKVIKWRVDFNKTSRKVFSITFKHPDGDGPQNQYMPAPEFGRRLEWCLSPTGGDATGTGNICAGQLFDEALVDCVASAMSANMGTMRTHCWMF